MQYKTTSHSDPAHADDDVYCYTSTSCTTCSYRLLFIEERSVECDTQAMFVLSLNHTLCNDMFNRLH